MKIKRIIRITVEQAADYLENFAREYAGIDFNPKDFYCGIGKDIKERAAWHRTDQIEFIETDSRDSAGAVEIEMNKRDFNTGRRPNNGGDEESVIVYIYPITPYTRETQDQR